MHSVPPMGGTSGFQSARSEAGGSAVGDGAASAGVQAGCAVLCPADLHQRLQARGGSKPLPGGGPPGSLQLCIDASGIPAGKQRAAAAEAAMRRLTQEHGQDIVGFGCGSAASWGQRKHISVQLRPDEPALVMLAGLWTVLVERVVLRQVPTGRPPPWETEVTVYQLPFELCRQGIGACILEAAGLDGRRVTAEFHPQERGLTDTSRVVFWVSGPVGESAAGLERLPAAFAAGACTVRLRVGPAGLVPVAELPGRGAAVAAAAGRPVPPLERPQHAFAAPGQVRRRRQRRRRRKAARRRAAREAAATAAAGGGPSAQGAAAGSGAAGCAAAGGLAAGAAAASGSAAGGAAAGGAAVGDPPAGGAPAGAGAAQQQPAGGGGAFVFAGAAAAGRGVPAAPARRGPAAAAAPPLGRQRQRQRRRQAQQSIPECGPPVAAKRPRADQAAGSGGSAGLAAGRSGAVGASTSQPRVVLASGRVSSPPGEWWQAT